MALGSEKIKIEKVIQVSRFCSTKKDNKNPWGVGGWGGGGVEGILIRYLHLEIEITSVQYTVL